MINKNITYSTLVAYVIDTEKRSINIAKEPNLIPHPKKEKNDFTN